MFLLIFFLGICNCLEDGLRKLADGPFWQYIPDLDWSLVLTNMGPAALYRHLVDSNTANELPLVHDGGKSVIDIVTELLEVDHSEFSADVPFTAYGLDSLSATQLSFSLRPFLVVSQLQLLSGLSLSDVCRRIEDAEQ